MMQYQIPFIDLPLHTFVAGLLGTLMGIAVSNYAMQRRKRRKA